MTLSAQSLILIGYGNLHYIQAAQQEEKEKPRIPQQDEQSRRTQDNKEQKGQGPQEPLRLILYIYMPKKAALYLLKLYKDFISDNSIEYCKKMVMEIEEEIGRISLDIQHKKVNSKL